MNLKRLWQGSAICDLISQLSRPRREDGDMLTWTLHPYPDRSGFFLSWRPSFDCFQPRQIVVMAAAKLDLAAARSLATRQSTPTAQGILSLILQIIEWSGD